MKLWKGKSPVVFLFLTLSESPCTASTLHHLHCKQDYVKMLSNNPHVGHKVAGCLLFLSFCKYSLYFLIPMSEEARQTAVRDIMTPWTVNRLSCLKRVKLVFGKKGGSVIWIQCFQRQEGTSYECIKQLFQKCGAMIRLNFLRSWKAIYTYRLPCGKTISLHLELVTVKGVH